MHEVVEYKIYEALKGNSKYSLEQNINDIYNASVEQVKGAVIEYITSLYSNSIK